MKKRRMTRQFGRSDEAMNKILRFLTACAVEAESTMNTVPGAAHGSDCIQQACA
jgi:hypothetical protein